MSEKIMERTIKEYLKEVKAKLPDWLKDKKEHKDILAELEEHIWSKAEELSETGHPTESSVKLAITHMGAPENIAKEYKRRGTPKVYITEELWPLYTKVLVIVFSVIVAISIVPQIVFNLILGGEPFIEVLGSIIVGIQGGLVISFVIISLIFVVLSMEGYFPEDFKSRKDLTKEKLLAETAEEKGWPISPKTGKPLKPFIKPIGEIIGGGQREDDINILLSKIKENNLPMEAFDWYLDIRKYGSVPHAGFGMGIERAVSWICGLKHIRETIPFPRTISRIKP